MKHDQPKFSIRNQVSGEELDYEQSDTKVTLEEIDRALTELQRHTAEDRNLDKMLNYSIG